jgi:hypothetical protein
MPSVLDAVAGGFEQAGVPLPERRFYSAGTPAIDCECLVVVLRQVYIGPPGDEAARPQRCDGPRTAMLEVQLHRCVPQPKGPRATKPKDVTIDEYSEQRAVDAWLLLDLAPMLDQWEGPFAPGGPGVIATVDAGEVQGDYQAMVLNLTIQVP